MKTDKAIIAFVAVAATAILAAGCSPKVNPLEAKPHKSIAWPAPPQPARVSYLLSITSPQDVGAKQDFFNRLVEFILGAEENDIVKPYGVTVDSKGRIIVADTSFKRVHVYDPATNDYDSIDEHDDAGFSSPIGVATDAEDNVYLTDSVLGKVFVFDRKGSHKKTIDGFARPTGIAINKKDGLVYVVDTVACNVRVLDVAGNHVASFGSPGNAKGSFNRPVDVFVDKNGDVYVTDTMNYRVQIFTGNGALIGTFGRHGDGSGDFGRPKGIAVDADGHIYVADAIFDTVQIFDRNGRYLLSFGSVGTNEGMFWLPSGLHIDQANRIYVSDSFNRRIQVFEYLGSGSTPLSRNQG